MKTILIQACVASRSGYGDHSRDIALGIIKSGKYDVKIINVNWGNTPANALLESNEDHMAILDCITTPNKVTSRPDLFMQVTVPNEFTPIGTKNIGITAGIETTICPPGWIEGINKMDLTIVPSEFSKMVIQQTTFEKKDKDTDKLIGILKLEKPIDVAFEGLDTDVYTKKAQEDSVDYIMKKVPETFNFLSVGHWLPGELGHDRKDLGMVVKVFLETFKNMRGAMPGLILKTSGATFSVIDRTEILNRIERIKRSFSKTDKLPNVHLLHGELTDEEMAALNSHPKVKAMVSFTKGEGFGRPFLEFSATGKPIIVPKWSGHVDFLPDTMTEFITGTLDPIHPSAIWDKNIFLENSTWFTVNYDDAAKRMKDVYKHYKKYKDRASGLNHHSKTNFNKDKMDELIMEIVDKMLSDVPEMKEFVPLTGDAIELPELNIKTENG